jgi:ABC-2 type transport system permease protein
MRAYAAFCGKEIIEGVRTFRYLILLAVLAGFGLLSPVLAYILPDIVNAIDFGEGMAFTMPEATAFDSWTQFFGNISQMGLIALVIIFAGITSSDIGKGTLINVLTKGMKRHTVILSKLSIAALAWTVCYWLAFAVTYAGTEFLWRGGELPHAFIVFSAPWVYGFFMISTLILGGIIFKGMIGSLLTAGAVTVVMFVLALIPSPGIAKFNPFTLTAGTLNILAGTAEPSDFAPAFIICGILTAGTIIASVSLFNKKQL